MSKLKMIKADAQVQVTFGTPFIQRLQQAMLYLANALSEEQLADLQQKMENKATNFETPAVEHTATLIMLLLDIESKVLEKNLFVEQEQSDDDEMIIPPGN